MVPRFNFYEKLSWAFDWTSNESLDQTGDDRDFKNTVFLAMITGVCILCSFALMSFSTVFIRIPINVLHSFVRFVLRYFMCFVIICYSI